MLRKIKNWVLLKWNKFQFDHGLKKGGYYTPLRNRELRNESIEREEELFAYLEVNKERFQSLFEYQPKSKDRDVINKLLYQYENSSPDEYKLSLELMGRRIQPKRTLNDIFSKKKVSEVNVNYKPAGELSETTKMYLDTNREMLNEHSKSFFLRFCEYKERRVGKRG